MKFGHNAIEPWQYDSQIRMTLWHEDIPDKTHKQ